MNLGVDKMEGYPDMQDERIKEHLETYQKALKTYYFYENEDREEAHDFALKVMELEQNRELHDELQFNLGRM